MTAPISIEHLLMPVGQETERAAELVAEGRVDPANIEAFDAFTAGQADSTLQVRGHHSMIPYRIGALCSPSCSRED
ncbi:hypothetical protein ACFW16_01415 [Inquilinus sp. NPDC058860]|uniref:hypothetical protein n=1 Tax=Inquilinus sp. NPDC058860 TaxID=3346652 RepID=UPI003689B7A4